MREGKTRKRMESGRGDVCSTVNGIWAEGGSQVGAHAAVFHGVVVWTHVPRALVSRSTADLASRSTARKEEEEDIEKKQGCKLPPYTLHW